MFQVFHLRLTVKQSATEPAGGAEVMSIEEELKVVVREPSEQEEQLGLEEEEMVGEQSELGGEQEEMELEVVMGRQSERMVVIEVKRETLSQDKEQWGQQEVVAGTDESRLCLGQEQKVKSHSVCVLVL